MFRSFIAKTRPSRGSLLRSGDRSFRVSRSSPSVSSSQAPPPAEKFKYQAESSGKQTINLADDFHRKVGNFIFGGFVWVGVTFYYVKEHILMNNANQDYLKKVSQSIKEQVKASAGPEELKNKKTNEEDPVVLSQQLADARAYIATQATIIQQNVERMTCLDAYFDYLAEKDPDFAAKFRPTQNRDSTAPQTNNESRPETGTAAGEEIGPETTRTGTGTETDPSQTF